MNTAFDPSRLKVAITRGSAEVNELEAANISKAVAAHLFSPPDQFDFSFLIQLHREMFGDVWDWAGQPRTSNLNLGIDWLQVEATLYNLTLDLPFWSGLPLAEQCAKLHHRLVAIHPFINGNGRWSRLAADVWSVKGDGLPSRWPAEFVGPDSPVRQEYLAALREADRNNFAPLISLHQRYAAIPPE